MIAADDITRWVYTYYEETLDIARYVWSTGDALAIHYGFHDTQTHSHAEALKNENRILATMCGITSTDRVLDAGCGIGGSAIWLAENIGCYVVGISLAPRHIRLATAHAARRKVSHRVEFHVADYNDTYFTAESFDVVWACESLSHSADTRRTLHELLRLLKPGGCFIMADGFQCRDAKDKREQRVYDTFIHGFGVYRTQRWEEFNQALVESGFQNVRRWDMSSAIRPAARRMRRIGVLTAPGAAGLFVLHKLLPNQPNIRLALDVWCTTLAQWRCLESGLWLYGIYYAEKPIPSRSMFDA
jgi:ubiquinone/menaquinone biosynthesis C-methylase UbiE